MPTTSALGWHPIKADTSAAPGLRFFGYNGFERYSDTTDSMDSNSHSTDVQISKSKKDSLLSINPIN